MEKFIPAIVIVIALAIEYFKCLREKEFTLEFKIRIYVGFSLLLLYIFLLDFFYNWALFLSILFLYGLSYPSLRLITKPLRYLRESVKRVALGDISRSVEVASRDEVGYISKMFDQTIKDVRKMLHDIREAERLKHEMEVARRIQDTFLPKYKLQNEYYEANAVVFPAEKVGGDYCAIIPFQDNLYGLVIADVSGKGIPATLVMSEVRALILYYARNPQNIKELLDGLNRKLLSDIPPFMFVTMGYGVLEQEYHKITYANAGHKPMIHLPYKADEVKLIRPKGKALGIVNHNEFIKSLEIVDFNIEVGDMIILYTDGVVDARNKKKERFGEKRFYDAIVKYSKFDIDMFLKGILNEVLAFSEGQELFDDIALLAVRRIK